MATTPSKFPTSSGRTEVFTWPPKTFTMHVTRPKSAKGRTRASLNFSHNVETYSLRVPSPPSQPVSFEVSHSQRGSVSASNRAESGVRISQEEIPELMQQVPSRPSSSLNKYMVLPSIRRKGTGDSADGDASEQTSKLHLNDRLQEVPVKPLYRGDRSAKYMLEAKSSKESVAKTPSTYSDKPPVNSDEKRSLLYSDLEEPLEEPRLLLAVRSPSGRRYERYFRPTDSLQTIVAVTELRSITRYKNCSIETMEVPRRSFSDLSKSLEDCGILNKSVLCIFQEQQDS
ncbi:UBX domain-containing protein 10 [Ambystoma mexicanum]|uniref:UBX domain-containing protein 10 n=1 Tax=Ambystoma mexicanum TaxID=8296 RepID=UPI0037E80213